MKIALIYLCGLALLTIFWPLALVYLAMRPIDALFYSERHELAFLLCLLAFCIVPCVSYALWFEPLFTNLYRAF